MHSTLTNNVPAFLIKLWKLVDDSKCDDLISWNSTGTTFLIRDQSRFSRELLPLYFKHNNFASFVRQLNMYGFRKVVNVEQGGLRIEKDEIEFQHVYFLKGQEYMLELIKRKVSLNKPTEDVKIQPQVVSKMMYDVKNLHGKQENLDTKLSTMKRENEALWREIATLRQQHMKQQQIVNKLIQFLLSLVQPNRGLGVKRKMPLMLNDTGHADSKMPRITRTFSLDGETGAEIHIASPTSSTYSGMKSSGPVIHDITDLVDAGVFGIEAMTGSDNLNSTAEVQPLVDSPLPSTSKDEMNSTETSPSTQLEPVVNTRPATGVESLLSGVDFVDHIDTMQMELDSLKDMLSSSGCTIDTSTLLGLFTMDDLSNKGLSDMSDISRLSGNEIVGNELTQYHPGMFDMHDGDMVTFNSDPIDSALQNEPLFEYVDAVLEGSEADSKDFPPPSTSPNLGETVPETNLALTPDLDLLVGAPGEADRKGFPLQPISLNLGKTVPVTDLATPDLDQLMGEPSLLVEVSLPSEKSPIGAEGAAI